MVVRVGNALAGVRANTAAAAQAARSRLAPYLVDVPAAHANFSVQLAEPGEAPSGPRPLHLLYWGSCVLVRSPDAGDVLDGLLDHLGAHADASLVRVDAELVLGRSGAALAPAAWRTSLVNHRRVLEQDGARHVPLPFVPLDPGTGEAVAGTGGRRYPVRVVVSDAGSRAMAAAALLNGAVVGPTRAGVDATVRAVVAAELWWPGEEAGSAAVAALAARLS
jgi:hypothetical protein